MTATPPVALTAAPASIELAGAAAGAIRVANPGRGATVVDVAPAGFALDLRGHPRVVVRRDPAVRVSVRPSRVVLSPGGSASLAVSSVVAPHARAGDHEALVLLTTRPQGAGGVGVRMRVGVLVRVRVAGAVVHRLEVRGVRARRGRLAVELRNAGNVVEQIGPRSFGVVLRRHGRVLATLRPAPRELLPGTRGIVELRGSSRLRGRVRAVVHVRTATGALVRRSFTVRLAPTGRGG